MTLPALTAERRAAASAPAPSAYTRRAAIDRYLLSAERLAANPPHAAAVVDRWNTDSRTEARSFHRPCSAHYAGSVNNFIQHV